jgi:TPR repeat protein
MACLPLLLPLSPSAAAAEGGPTAICDRLAADPFAGFGPKSWDKPFQGIDAASAVPACEEAMRLHPGEPRYRLQMAIAYLAAQDQDRAKPLLKQLVEEGNAPAMVLLANISSDRDSLELISKAASLDNPAALIFLAFAQLTGDGVKQNVLEGIRLLSHASDLGNTEAMIVLAGIYLEGRFGVPPDAAEGRRLILDAASRGDPSAKEVLEQVERAQAAASARMAPPTPTKPPAP